VVLEIKPSRENCSLRRIPYKTGRDTHPNKYENQNLEAQEK
jgi:hypothetical protein